MNAVPNHRWPPAPREGQYERDDPANNRPAEEHVDEADRHPPALAKHQCKQQWEKVDKPWHDRLRNRADVTGAQLTLSPLIEQSTSIHP
jgi:hypothetical protein